MKILSHKAISLAILIVLSSFVSLLSPATTSAAVKYSELNQSQQAKILSYAKYIQDCYSLGYSVETNSSKVANGQLFYNGFFSTNPNIYVANKSIQSEVSALKDGNQVSCGANDGELTKKALGALGISGTELVCQMGYKRDKSDQGAGCKSATDQNFKSNGGIDNRVAAFNSAIKQLTGLDVDNPGNNIWYLWHINMLESGCGVNLSSPNSDSSGSYLYELNYLDASGTPHEKGKFGGTKLRSNYPFQQYGYYGSKSCQYALDQANQLYGAYKSKVIEQNSKDRCEQKGYKNELLNSCLDGVKNQSAGANYCAKYPKEEQQEACKWGQGIQNPTKPQEVADDSKDKTSCAIDGIGWIVCPVVQFLADIADKAYGFLGDNFLAIDAKLFSGSSSDQTRTSWQAIQGIANIAFVIAFIVIIYSQLTGAGLSNYGVKKMLPRIIIAAILVNISYIICQLAVDISNILGYGLRNTLPSIITQSDTGVSVSSFDFGKSAATILAAGLGIGLALPLLGTAVTAAVVALVFVGVLLIARKALIVLLVVISPLAFVAYLLPNTEQFFTKWRKMFVGLLAVFPVVGLLFGAGSLASTILRNATPESDTVGRLIAATVGILPLFAVWPVLKGSLDAAGSIGAKINGMSKSAQSSADNARKNVQSRIKNSELAQYRNGLKAQRAAEIKAGAYKGRLGVANPRNWASAFNRGFNNSNLSGGFGDMRAAEAVGIANGIDDAAMKSTTALLQSKNLTAEQMNELAKSNGSDKEYVALMKERGINAEDTKVRQAAVGIAMGQNGLAANLDLIGHTKESGDDGYRKAVAKGMMENKLADNAAFLGGDMVDKVARTGVDQNDIKAATASTIERQKFSTNSVAKQDAEALKIISDVANNGYTVTKDGKEQNMQVNEQRLQALRAQAQQVQSTEEIARGVTGAQAEHINDIATGGAKEGQDFNTR